MCWRSLGEPRGLYEPQILHANDLFEDTVSRSYYAVMHAAKAALLVHDVIAESHAAVRRLFGSVLVRPDLIEEWASVLAECKISALLPIIALVWGWDAAALHLVEDAKRFSDAYAAISEASGLLWKGRAVTTSAGEHRKKWTAVVLWDRVRRVAVCTCG